MFIEVKNRFLGIVVVLCLILLMFVLHDKEKEDLLVSIVNPVEKEVVDELNVTGNVYAWQESVVGSELSGIRVEEVLADVGQVVKKGQVLAILNSETILAELNIARSGLLEAEANLKQAKENADRARSLDNTNALSSQQMNQYLTAEFTAKAKLESAKSNYDLKKVKLEQTKIKAPDNGIISERRVSVGNLVGGELFKIIRQEKLQWRPEIDVADFDFISKGKSVSIVDRNGGIIKAKINEISPKIDYETRKGQIIVDLPKELHMNKIHVGMYLNGKIKLEKRKSLFVPEEALTNVDNGKDSYDYVFILEGQNRAKRVRVESGQKIDDMVEIKYGIESSDNIIVGDLKKLNDRDSVRLKD